MNTIFYFIFASFLILIAISLLSFLIGDLNSEQLRRRIFGCNHQWEEYERYELKNGKTKYIMKCSKCGKLRALKL